MLLLPLMMLRFFFLLLLLLLLLLTSGLLDEPLQLTGFAQGSRQDGTASFLQRNRQAESAEQRHFRFGRRRRHHREDVVDDALQAREGDAQAPAILEVAQSAGEAVEEAADRRRLVLAETPRVMTAFAVVPQQTWGGKKGGI